MILRLGDVYISILGCESYNSEFNIEFTTNIKNARRFDKNEILIWCNVLKVLFGVEFETIKYEGDEEVDV